MPPGSKAVLMPVKMRMTKAASVRNTKAVVAEKRMPLVTAEKNMIPAAAEMIPVIAENMNRKIPIAGA